MQESYKIDWFSSQGPCHTVDGLMLSLLCHAHFAQAKWLINAAKCCQQPALNSVPLPESFVFILCRLVLWSPLKPRKKPLEKFLNFHANLRPIRVHPTTVCEKWLKIKINHLAKHWDCHLVNLTFWLDRKVQGNVSGQTVKPCKQSKNRKTIQGCVSTYRYDSEGIT